MIQKPIKRSDQEWMALIQECRTSGLSDSMRCADHDIPISTFYNKISQLRKKACEIPSHSGNVQQPSQQVVALAIKKEPIAVAPEPYSPQIDPASISIPAVTFTFSGGRLDINNHADKETVLNAVLALKQLC